MVNKPLIGAALMAALVLTGCGKDPHANDKCVQSHEYTWMMPIVHHVGKNTYTTYIPMTSTTCDKWVPKEEK